MPGSSPGPGRSPGPGGGSGPPPNLFHAGPGSTGSGFRANPFELENEHVRALARRTRLRPCARPQAAGVSPGLGPGACCTRGATRSEAKEPASCPAPLTDPCPAPRLPVSPCNQDLLGVSLNDTPVQQQQQQQQQPTGDLLGDLLGLDAPSAAPPGPPPHGPAGGAASPFAAAVTPPQQQPGLGGDALSPKQQARTPPPQPVQTDGLGPLAPGRRSSAGGGSTAPSPAPLSPPSRQLSGAASVGAGGVGLIDVDEGVNSHPMDMTPGDLASLGLAPGKARRLEVGVHGEAPAPGDDEVRIFQVGRGRARGTAPQPLTHHPQRGWRCGPAAPAAPPRQ
jgi:hypothetical protein